MELCLCGKMLVNMEEVGSHVNECYYAKRKAAREIDRYERSICKKTLSGKHNWVEGECEYCEMINDLGGDEHGR